MRNIDWRQAQVGYWYTWCCHLDLSQIVDETDLAECLEEWELDSDLPPHTVWKTRRDALLDIRDQWTRYPDVIAEIDALLANDAVP